MGDFQLHGSESNNNDVGTIPEAFYHRTTLAENREKMDGRCILGSQ